MKFTKNLISLLLTVSLIFVSVSIVYAETDESSVTYAFAYSNETNVIFTPGDINDDYVVNVSDATIIQKHLVQQNDLADKEKLAADFDGDGIITIDDVTEIQKKIANINYNCVVSNDNSYVNINVKFSNKADFENSIEIEKALDGFEYYKGRKINNTGIYLIKSADQLYDLLGYCQSSFDKEFFVDNALIVWTEYDPSVYDYRQITQASVSGNTINLKRTFTIPFLDLDFNSNPNTYNLNLFYKVNKSDVKDVDTIININENVYLH